MNFKKGLCLSLICLLSIGFIFFNSSQSSVESNARSYKFAEKMLVVTKEYPNIEKKVYTITHYIAKIEKYDTTGITTAGMLNLIIRKCAHGFEFFILALILCLTFDIFELKLRNITIYSLFLVLLSADCDEFFQMFVVGRTSTVTDVLIDFCGGVIACITFVVIKFLCNAIKKKRSLSK